MEVDHSAKAGFNFMTKLIRASRGQCHDQSRFSLWKYV